MEIEKVSDGLMKKTASPVCMRTMHLVFYRLDAFTLARWREMKNDFMKN